MISRDSGIATVREVIVDVLVGGRGNFANYRDPKRWRDAGEQFKNLEEMFPRGHAANAFLKQ